MASLAIGDIQSGLERSCGPAVGDWFRTAPPSEGLERVEARFAGHAFAPHRHDTYALGFTLQGVQSFRYRGTAEHSRPGEVFVLHPDELHDGRGEIGVGFRYRILYVDPRLIGEALDEPGAPLPFVRQAVSRDSRLASALGPALAELERPLDDLEREQVLFDLAEALAAADTSRSHRRAEARDRNALRRARELLDAAGSEGVTAAVLEAATGLSRYALARQFRASYGTSPHRYLVLRRLDRARGLIRAGMPLAEAAAACGFADQSHLTRQFKSAYGLSPGRWLRLSA